MSDLVRVTKTVGDTVLRFNVGRAEATARDDVEVVEESAYGVDGQPRPVERIDKRSGRPVKPRVTVDEAAAKKTPAAKKATAPKAAQSAEQSDTAPSSKES